MANRRKLSEEQLASVWLKEMKSGSNSWDHLRNAGLCGSLPPRRVIFALILKCLCMYAYTSVEDALSSVTYFRSNFADDPGLDGCLLELEEILKLKANRSMVASLLKMTNQTWAVDKTIDLPTKGSSVNIFEYIESQSRLQLILHSPGSSWNMIAVPSAFCV